MKTLPTTAILLLCASMTPAVAAPSLKDCERIIQQLSRQRQIAANVQAQYAALAREPASLCSYGKQAMPQFARIVAEKRAVRSNSCWTPTDEAYFQRMLVIQKNHVRSVALSCVAARNPGLMPAVTYPRRMSATRD